VNRWTGEVRMIRATGMRTLTEDGQSCNQLPAALAVDIASIRSSNDALRGATNCDILHSATQRFLNGSETPRKTKGLTLDELLGIPPPPPGFELDPPIKEK
jgi:hypothetical protein